MTRFDSSDPLFRAFADVLHKCKKLAACLGLLFLLGATAGVPHAWLGPSRGYIGPFGRKVYEDSGVFIRFIPASECVPEMPDALNRFFPHP